MNTVDLQKLIAWLIDGARSASDPPERFAEICERLVQAGLPLWRVGIFVRTLHPDILGVNLVWRPGAKVVFGSVGHDMLDSPEFRNSPLAFVFHEGREVRHRLSDPETIEVPFYDDM
jgi:adenylate cyclase